MRLAPLLLAAACGGGPQLTNLRCRDPQRCQDLEDPLKVLLAVDFADESGTLDQGRLDLRLGGNTQATLTLADIFRAQGIAPGTKKGTLQIDDDLSPDRITQGEQLRVSVEAVNGQGEDSNEPSLTFALQLGGP